jgi:hypothetical protein
MGAHYIVVGKRFARRAGHRIDREGEARAGKPAGLFSEPRNPRPEAQRPALAKSSFIPGSQDATFSRFGFEYLKMQYRGKGYIVVQGIEPDSWKWTVDLDEQTSKSGEAKTRGLAVSAVVLLVDRLLTRKSRSTAA